MMSPWQVCLEGSNWEGGCGARLLCCNIPKKPKVRHTRMAGLRAPRLDDKMHN